MARPKFATKITTAFLALMIASLAACSSGSAQGNSDAPGSITIGLNGGNIVPFTAYLLAEGPEYFGQVSSQFGVKINTQNFPGGPSVLSAFLGGQLQGVFASVSFGTVPASKGENLQYVYNSFTGTGSLIVAAKKYEQTRGSDMAKFNGASWCYTAVGGGGYLSVLAAAESAGLDWSKQKGIAIGSVSAYLPTMKAGRCDVTPMDTGNSVNAVQQNIGYIALDLNQPQVQLKVFGGNSLQLGSGLFLSPAFTAKYPKLSAALVKALVRAQLYVQQHINDPQSIYSMLPATFKSTVAQDAFAAQWKLTAPAVSSASGYISQGSIDATVAAETRAGLLSAPVPSSFWNNTFVEQAYKSLGYTVPTDGSAVDVK